MYNISGHGGPKFASLAPNATVPVQFHLLNNELISQCKPTTLEYPGGGTIILTSHTRHVCVCVHVHALIS
jgi:hypothetical protein